MDPRQRRRLSRRERRHSTNVFSGISQAKLQIFREAFSMIDQDGDGAISKHDLRRILTSLGTSSTDAVIDEMLTQVPGTLNFTAFLAMFAHMTAELDTDEVIENAFSILDDGTGQIDAHDFAKLLSTVGYERYTQEEINAVMRKAPIDKNGRMNLQAMARVMTFQDQFQLDL